VKVGVARDLPAKPLLGERIGRRGGSKAGLHVSHGTLGAGCRPRARVSGQRVTLDDHEPRLDLRNGLRKRGDQAVARHGEIGGREKRRHLDVASHVEFGESPAHRLRMLPAVDDDAGKRPAVAQLVDHRGELDAFRPRSGDDQDLPVRESSMRTARQDTRPRRVSLEHEPPKLGSRLPAGHRS
jgi:hypothetical protein